MRVTIKDVAKAAGVSPSTVSRVINNVPGIGDEMRTRVRALMKEMDYRPDLNARSLVKRQTGNIALIVPRGMFFVFSNPFFALVMEGIGEVLDDYEYNYLFCSSPKQHRRMFQSRVVDGTILFAVRLGDPYIYQAESGELPTVLVGSYLDTSPIPFVRPDDEGGIYEAVKHLADLGHRRIALLNGPLSSIKSVKSLDGYRKAVVDFDLDYDDDVLVHSLEFTAEAGYSGGMTLFGGKNPPTAIVCSSDLIAYGAMKAASDCGVRIPTQCSVVGFGDFPLSGFLNPPLTTMRTPLREMGLQAGHLLHGLMNGQEMPQKRVVVPTTLVARGSTSAPAMRTT
ncbi:MAG: LacI family DNA-binding transcriptional regulator [Firmicutes bacterium]|nr:LacI family DNA-binding transcriptional regulator [Bacillota bacterium]